MQLTDERGSSEEGRERYLLELLEIGGFLPESLLTYIYLLVIPLPEPEGP